MLCALKIKFLKVTIKKKCNILNTDSLMNRPQKKFEVPYNFDFSLIDFYAGHKSMISFVYLPPFKEDAIHTRTVMENSNKGSLGYMPDSRAEYTEHLSYIQNKGLEFYVLWQDNKMIEPDVIRFYQDLGARGFVVGNDKNASLIRKYDKSLRLIASITMKLTFYDILNKDFSDYESVILFFPFTRALNAIKKLSHIKEKLIVMPNTICYTDCYAVHHWFPKNNELQPLDRCLARENLDKCCFIYPEHLYLFDDYVGGYKLQGREYPTLEIIKNAEAYFSRNGYDKFIEPAVDKKLNKMIAEKGLEEYYNTKSDDVISVSH